MSIILEEDVSLGPPKKTVCHVYDCAACTGVGCPHRPDQPFDEAWRHHRVTGEPLPTWMRRRVKK